MIIYDQSSEDYHASKAIGASTARLALDSIQLFKDCRDGLLREPSTAATGFGTAFHARMLQPDLFQTLVSEGPINEKTGSCYGRDTKAFKVWEAENPGRLVVDSEEMASIAYMEERMPAAVKAILRSPSARTEVSVYRDSAGLSLKCRPDHLDGTVCTDLKTIDRIDNIGRAFRSHKYWFAQEWYKRLLREETGQPHTFQFIFAEKAPPYRWRIVRTNAEVCEEAAMLVRGVLTMLSDAQERGNWHDTGAIMEEITWPDCGHYEEET